MCQGAWTVFFVRCLQVDLRPTEARERLVRGADANVQPVHKILWRPCRLLFASEHRT